MLARHSGSASVGCQMISGSLPLGGWPDLGVGVAERSHDRRYLHRRLDDGGLEDVQIVVGPEHGVVGAPGHGFAEFLLDPFDDVLFQRLQLLGRAQRPMRQTRQHDENGH